MDLEGIECGMLFPSAGLYLPSVGEAPYAVALCRAYNNWLFDYCRADPKRLLGVGVVPVQDIKEAVSETRRIALELGFKGAFVRPNPVQGRTLDDPYYDPFYAALQELGIPLMVHEGSGAYLPTAGAERFPGQWFFTHMVSHPFEQMLACLSLICKGVLERFPHLLVAFLESGAGWLPYWLWRMDEHREILPFQVPWLKLKPSEYFRRQCYVSCEPDEDNLAATVQAVGEDRILFASDYPHWDAIFPGATKAILDNDGISPSAKKKIMSGNAQKLLGW
jgi:predicted TIM-barrel fold metal-dependent hydrolase